MNWYCVYTKPLKEKSTASYLSGMLGFECYYPKLVQSVVIRRVRRIVKRPLFPRYFFCRFDPDEHLRTVRYAADVVDIVNSGMRPLEVHENIIDGLRAEANGPAEDEILAEPELFPGCRLEIVSGPLRGLEGVLLRTMDDGQRVAVLLSALNLGSVVTDRCHCSRVA